VLGISETKIQILPQDIKDMKSLQEIFVHDTPLKNPRLVLAMRGVEAIREYFGGEKKIRKDKVAEN